MLSNAFLATVDLPVESDDLWSLQEVNLIEGHIRAAKLEDAIEKAKLPWASKQQDLLGQLLVAVRRSRSDLSRQNKLAEAAKSAADAEAKKKEEEKRSAEEKSEKLEAMKVLEKTSHEAFLNIDWGKLSNAQPMQVVSNDKEVQDMSKHSMLAEPFIVSSCSLLDTVMSEEAKVRKTLAAWTSAFAKQQDTVLQDNTQAPFVEAHGSQDLQPLWDLLLFPFALVKAPHIIVTLIFVVIR